MGGSYFFAEATRFKATYVNIFLIIYDGGLRDHRTTSYLLLITALNNEIQALQL